MGWEDPPKIFPWDGMAWEGSKLSWDGMARGMA